MRRVCFFTFAVCAAMAVLAPGAFADNWIGNSAVYVDGAWFYCGNSDINGWHPDGGAFDGAFSRAFFGEGGEGVAEWFSRLGSLPPVLLSWPMAAAGGKPAGCVVTPPMPDAAFSTTPSAKAVAVLQATTTAFTSRLIRKRMICRA